MAKSCDLDSLLAEIKNKIYYFNTIQMFVMAATLYITFFER